MSELLKVVLSLSLSGTILYCIILLLKPLYKNHLSKRWQYYILLIVIVRMLLPFTPDTTLVGSVFQHLENINILQYQTAPQAKDAPSDFGSDGSYKTQLAPSENIDTAPPISMQSALSKADENIWILWAAVALALLTRKITMYQSFVRFVKAGRAEVSDIEMLNTLAELGDMIGVKRPVELFTNPLISSPMLLGFFRPYIILPSIELEKAELAYIIRHELTHYKRLDMFYKWLAQITVCLHWFNPLVYLLTKEINKSCELSCDEAIIETLNLDEKKAYGDTLLNILKTAGHYNDKLATVTLTEGAEQLKERLDAIMKFKKSSKIAVAMMLVLTLALTVGATAIGAYAASPVNQARAPMWSVTGSNSRQPYTYSQESYYQAPYIFEIGRNLNEHGEKAYTNRTTITLSDKTTITVSFDVSCKEYASDESALAALKQLMEKLIKKYADSSLPMKKPLIVSVHRVGNSDLSNLAEEYYTNHESNKFYAIFSSLDEEIQKNYCTRMIEEEKNAFLAGTAKFMESEMVNFCLEKTYQKENIALFAGIVPYLTDDQKQAWIARASRDDKNTFLSVLTQQETYPLNIKKSGNEKGNSTRQESLTRSFAPFRSYGLVYSAEQDRAFFHGKEVKAFVDIRDMYPGGSYSFNLGYIEPDANSTIYLMAVRDKKGMLTGIQEMPKEIQDDLYGLPQPYIPGLEDELKDNMSEIREDKNDDSAQNEKYLVFNATTSLSDASITATDKFNSTDIPQTIADWLSACQGSYEVHVKRTIVGNKIDAWIYYDSGTRLAWNVNAHGTTLRFMLTDNAPESVSGATLIHYQAPIAHQGLEVYYKSKELKINVQ